MILPPKLVPIISIDIYRKFKPGAISPDRGAVNSLAVDENPSVTLPGLGGAAVGDAQTSTNLGLNP
jgi:hypothetical protein